MGWVNIFKPLSTFLSSAPLINLCKVDNYFLWNFLLVQGIEPRAAGFRSKYANLCFATPHHKGNFWYNDQWRHLLLKFLFIKNRLENYNLILFRHCTFFNKGVFKYVLIKKGSMAHRKHLNFLPIHHGFESRHFKFGWSGMALNGIKIKPLYS